MTLTVYYSSILRNHYLKAEITKLNAYLPLSMVLLIGKKNKNELSWLCTLWWTASSSNNCTVLCKNVFIQSWANHTYWIYWLVIPDLIIANIVTCNWNKYYYYIMRCCIMRCDQPTCRKSARARTATRAAMVCDSVPEMAALPHIWQPLSVYARESHV